MAEPIEHGWTDPRGVYGRYPTKLEEIAQAIASKHLARDQLRAVQAGCDILISIEGYMEDAMEDARAAIEAMREPTEAMIDDAYPLAGGNAIAPIWRAMIDAALKEGGKT